MRYLLPVLLVVVGIGLLYAGVRMGRRSSRLPGPAVTRRWTLLTGFATGKGVFIDYSAHATFLGGLLVVIAILLAAHGGA